MLQQLESIVEPEFSATALEDSFRAEQEHAEQMRAELEMEFAKTTLDLDRDFALAYLNESLPADAYFQLKHEVTAKRAFGRIEYADEWRAAAIPNDTESVISTANFATPAEAATELVKLWDERRAIRAA